MFLPYPGNGNGTVTLLAIFPGIPRNCLPNLCYLTFDPSQKEGAKRNISPSCERIWEIARKQQQHTCWAEKN
eukprot:scaffold248368_cov31-Cyclotella_meneghiniana.AAC.1